MQINVSLFAKDFGIMIEDQIPHSAAGFKAKVLQLYSQSVYSFIYPFLKRCRHSGIYKLICKAKPSHKI